MLADRFNDINVIQQTGLYFGMVKWREMINQNIERKNTRN